MFSTVQYPTLWDAPPGVLTPVVAIAGAFALLVASQRLFGKSEYRPIPRKERAPLIQRPKTEADYLFWIGAIFIVSAAAWTVTARVMTSGSALLVLLGTLLLIVALFKSGRSDANHWAAWLLLVSNFVIQLLPYIRQHRR